jgi:hypothetical protein
MSHESDEKIDLENDDVPDLVPDYDDLPALVDADAPLQARPPPPHPANVQPLERHGPRLVAMCRMCAIVERAERKYNPQADPVLRPQMARVIAAMEADRGERAIERRNGPRFAVRLYVPPELVEARDAADQAAGVNQQ